MKLSDIEKLYQRCLKEYSLTVEEAVQQLVIAGVTQEEYFNWILKYHK